MVNIDSLTVAKHVATAEKKPKLFIETYGCQMNVNDSEVVVSIMEQSGYGITNNMSEADLILVNTCAIRDNAEQRVRTRLDVFAKMKRQRPSVVIGVIGCMAERLKEKLLEEEKAVDLIAGPDAYRDLPKLVSAVGTGHKAANVLLSREETYADISPVRLDENKVSAFISIMRGCNNLCAFCVVPFTRGVERSRSPETIVREANEVLKAGYKEITLLGQNVNSYYWDNNGDPINFARLLAMVAMLSPQLRVRFSTSHPKDISDELLFTIAKYPNICKSIHLPAQSGSSRVLKLMNRRYTREWYMERISAIKRIIPGCSISTDIMTGFSTETEADHKETLTLMEWVGYEFAYMFKYSLRPGTHAEKFLSDDISESTKSARLTEIIKLQSQLSDRSNKADVGKTFEVLVEGTSKKSDEQLYGRTTQNKVVVFPKASFKPGDYAMVEITGCTSATLLGKIVG